jgi:FkbM family methyltransferase
MQNTTDWLTLWKELCAAQKRFWDRSHPRQTKQESSAREDCWTAKAKHFDAMVRKRWARPDSSREYVLELLKRHPNASVLDIGAGTGAWALLMAGHAGRVTALEPSAAMREIMDRNARQAGIKNLTMVEDSWPEAAVERHDFTLASHSMYGYPDFETFVRRMEQTTGNTCFLIMRLSPVDSLMARITRRVWGHPYDSPNFQVGFNALIQMGIHANVLMETPNHWEPWTHDTIEAALAEVAARFDLGPDSPHLPYIEEMLQTHLTRKEGGYAWPPGTRSALVYWQPDGAATQGEPRR